MQAYHIHIQGMVQGVGFRPFVYKRAVARGLKGWVNNTTDGVHIEINATEEEARAFLQELLEHLPPLAVVTQTRLYPVAGKPYQSFEIIRSVDTAPPRLLLTPDTAMCADCRRELHDPANRRYGYPFITCTNCGPRYSIITALPYDRPHTTMASFDMCPACRAEYTNPLDRRYYSQTNSCPDCAIEMQWYEKGRLTPAFTDMDYVVSQWEQGHIIAIKGIGGYLLTCDATNHQAVETLRRRKHRPAKPFALMYPSLETLSRDARLSEAERKALTGPDAPIVLLRLTDEARQRLPVEAIHPGLGRTGVMLPYTPLMDLLLTRFGKPVVATSGNLSGSPIIYDDDEALRHLTSIADALLMNNRAIVVPQDDGVMQFTPRHHQKIVLRRSRGRAPVYLNPPLRAPRHSVLATGSMLKSVFGFSQHDYIYLSQYLGNTETYEAQAAYEHTLAHLQSILRPHFDAVVTDKHPGYFATQLGERIARAQNIPLYRLQHHRAHFYSVLAENHLLTPAQPVMGVVWDGTGLGDDGHIWGGEFFGYDGRHMPRLAHIGRFDFILADKMVREPRISLLAIARNIPGAESLLRPKFTETEWQVYRRLLQKPPLQSTSMGRLFDAVASLLTGIDRHTYDAEASIKLEWMATGYLEKHPQTEAFPMNEVPSHFVRYIMQHVVDERRQNADPARTAARFHLTLVQYIRLMARLHGYRQLAFSGGVFQNALLVDLIRDRLQDEFRLYFHRQLAPNDEGIALGQMVWGWQQLAKNSPKNHP